MQSNALAVIKVDMLSDEFPARNWPDLVGSRPELGKAGTFDDSRKKVTSKLTTRISRSPVL
jgi:hypothetical protein